MTEDFELPSASLGNSVSDISGQNRRVEASRLDILRARWELRTLHAFSKQEWAKRGVTIDPDILEKRTNASTRPSGEPHTVLAHTASEGGEE